MPTFLELVIAHHDGIQLWKATNTITTSLSFGGLAFASRFNFAGQRERRLEIATKKSHTVMDSFSAPEQRSVFTPECVWIEDRAGHTIAERSSPRLAFRSWRHYLWWDNLDLLYFAGYASWNCFTTPFLLSQGEEEMTEIEPWRENGEVWRRLAARFPESIPTHCRE